MSAAADCNNTEIRLNEGRNDSEGRVEVCFQGQWGRVCGDSWDSSDAVVVCRQLSLTSECKRYTECFNLAPRSKSHIHMAYGSTPYVGMTPQKMAATLKVTNDTLEISALDRSMTSMSHIRHYRVVLWATGPLTLLESIAKVQTGKSIKRANHLSSDFFSFPHHDSTITAEAILTIQTRKNSIMGIVPSTYRYPRTRTIMQ